MATEKTKRERIRGFKNMWKVTKQNIQGMIKTILFLFFIFYLQRF